MMKKLTIAHAHVADARFAQGAHGGDGDLRVGGERGQVARGQVLGAPCVVRDAHLDPDSHGGGQVPDSQEGGHAGCGHCVVGRMMVSERCQERKRERRETRFGDWKEFA